MHPVDPILFSYRSLIKIVIIPGRPKDNPNPLCTKNACKILNGSLEC